MSAYKFITKISGNGTIQIPFNASLFDKEVEVTIIPKSEKNDNQKKATDFVKKWGGFLKNTSTDNSQYDYLMKKYK